MYLSLCCSFVPFLNTLITPPPVSQKTVRNGSSGCWIMRRRCLEACPSPAEPDLKVLHAKIGQLALENDFLEGALTKTGLLSARR